MIRNRHSVLFFVAATFAFVVLVLPRPILLRQVHQSVLPYSLIASSNVYFRERSRLRDLIRNRAKLSELPLGRAKEPMTVVVVIGESSRADHFRINGYSRPTSPFLESRGAISFSHVTSCESVTKYAVPCIFTRAHAADLMAAYRETSFVSVFRKLGFDTHWISNQGMFWSGSLLAETATITATAAIASEAEHVRFVNLEGDVDHMRVHDEALLPWYYAALQNREENQLIVLHTAGSHWHYDSHYPSSFRVFQPICGDHNPQRCAHDELVNSYDNAILHADSVMERIISAVEQRNALVVYASDHGESLGEGGRFGHTPHSTHQEQRHVAMFAWASSSFAAKHADRLEALRKHRTERLTQRNIFHSVLDCAGVQASFVNASLSLCR